ncbi:MAG: ATPase [Bacteroidales bacterium]
MILIAESGSTNIEWRLIYNNGVISNFSGVGINPVHMSIKNIDLVLAATFSEWYKILKSDNILDFKNDKELELYYYGAGVLSEEYSLKLASAFIKYIPNAICHFESDILAAARALCKNEKGIVGILGTGSNSCFYDGQKITDTIASGGYILGDEGSGAYMGKKLISDYIKNLMPSDLRKIFQDRYALQYSSIVKKIYHSDSPSAFLASFSKFIYEFRKIEYMSNLIHDSLSAYFIRNITSLDYKNFDVNLTGSIAWYYKDYIKIIAKESGIKIGRILQLPIDELVEYHIEKLI